MSVMPSRIEITPGVCGGRPRIAGHRIRVQDVAVWYEYMGMSPDEIVSGHPGITLSDVHAALSYYYDHQAEIRSDIDADAVFVAQMKAATPSRLARKLMERNDGSSSPSP